MNNILSTLAGEGSSYFPASDQQAANPAGTPLVNLNEVVQYQLLSRRSQLDAMQAIIRYDRLPHVMASGKEMAELVGNIFNSILNNPPTGTKLFIYIRCEKDAGEVLNLSLPEGLQLFNISVYTNIVADEAWQQKQESALSQMKALITEAQGSLSFFNITKTGCLYQMVLPGKLL